MDLQLLREMQRQRLANDRDQEAATPRFPADPRPAPSFPPMTDEDLAGAMPAGSYGTGAPAQQERLDKAAQQRQQTQATGASRAAAGRASRGAQYNPAEGTRSLQEDTAQTTPTQQVQRSTGEKVGAQEGRLRDMDAERSAREKLEKYNASVRMHRERIDGMLSRGETVDMSDPENRPPVMPDFSSAELNMLNVSYPEEIGEGNSAAERYGDEYVDLFIKNQGLSVTKDEVLSDPGLKQRYDVWLSDNFGNYEDDDYVSPGKAEQRVEQAEQNVEYKPFSSRTAASRYASARTDPQQQGDPLYRERDGQVNISTAAGRGSRVPVHGIGERGGTSYRRRTAGGSALSQEYLDSVFGPDVNEDGQVNQSAIDQKALFYAESVGYDLSDPNMTEAERIGKARKVYEDHKSRARSYDTVFDAAAGEEGEWTYRQNQASKDRQQQTKARVALREEINRHPERYTDLFGAEGSEFEGVPDPSLVEDYMDRMGLFPEPIDTEYGTVHPANRDRARRAQVGSMTSALGRGEAWRQHQRMRGNENNMRDPSINRQMLMRSIQEAEDRGATPGEIARIYEFYGLPRIASQEREMGTVKMATDAQVSAAEAARPAPEEGEPLPAEQIRLNNDAAIEPYATNSQDFSEYGQAVRTMGVLVNSERAANDMAPLEGDELELESASRTSQAWLSTPGGQAEMSAAVVAGHDGMANFLRSRPAVSELFGLIAQRVESKIVDNPWEWLVGSGKDEERSRAFLEEAIASAGLTADFEAVVAQWFEERAAIARGA